MTRGYIILAITIMTLALTVRAARQEQESQAEPPPPPIPPPAPLELTEVQRQIDALRADVARLGVELDDARVLTLIGGPKRKWRGGGVSCDGGPYLPGSHGEAAYRALRATGWCEPSQLPEARRR